MQKRENKKFEQNIYLYRFLAVLQDFRIVLEHHLEKKRKESLAEVIQKTSLKAWVGVTFQQLIWPR